MIGTAHDITEQRKLEEALEMERARLIAAQSVGKVGSRDTDRATKAVIW